MQRIPSLCSSLDRFCGLILLILYIDIYILELDNLSNLFEESEKRPSSISSERTFIFKVKLLRYLVYEI